MGAAIRFSRFSLPRGLPLGWRRLWSSCSSARLLRGPVGPGCVCSCSAAKLRFKAPMRLMTWRCPL